MKKRVVLLVLTLVLLGALLASCGGNEAPSPDDPAPGHTHTYTETTTAPTCTEQGYTVYSCSCGYSYMDTYVPATGHTEVADPAVAPTESEDGLTEGKHCSVCRAVLVKQNVVYATGSIGLAYEANTDGVTCTVTGIGTCTERDIIIPSYSPDGKRVTAIARRAFMGSHITSIVIPASVTEIGAQIFYKATDLHTVYYNSTYSSEDNLFLNVSNIRKVVFGGTRVPDDMLKACKNVKEVVIAGSVTQIDSLAFFECKSLTSVTIGNGVTKIGNSAFYGCSSLKSVTIGNSVTKIDDGAFWGCSSLMSITIPDSVTEIGSLAFEGCSSLKSITIPNGVTQIGSGAFYDCFALTSITIPDSVTWIGNMTFYYCYSLTSITIPDSVTQIGYHAFYNCSSLTSITFTGTMVQWNNLSRNSTWGDYRTGHYTVYCTDGTIK